MEGVLLLVLTLTCFRVDSANVATTNRTTTSWDLCGSQMDHNLTFIPADLRPITEGTTVTVHVLLALGITDMASVDVTSSDERVTKIQSLKIHVNDSGDQNIALAGREGHHYNSNTSFAVAYQKNSTGCDGIFVYRNDVNTVIDVNILGLRLGKSQLTISLHSNKTESGRPVSGADTMGAVKSGKILEFPQTYPVIVLRNVGLKDQVFHITIQVILAIINFTFGCELDISIVVSYLKRPLAPSLGFCSQFIFMPLLGLAITLILRMDPVYSIGLISLACSPGGGASNAWTILLGGDINLSLTMTFLSLALALGMMPLWMFLVTRVYFEPGMVQVPYLKIFTTLCFFVGPCFLGVALKKIKPTFAKAFTKFTKPLSILFLFWVLTFGTYVNLYMWRIMREVPLTIVAGILLPWCGFAFGLFLSLLARQGQQRAIAISIETGIQNIGVPIVLLQRSFPQPDGDLAATVASATGIFTPLPLFITLIVLTIKKRCNGSGDKLENIESPAVDDVNLNAAESSEMFIKPSPDSPGDIESSVVIT